MYYFQVIFKTKKYHACISIELAFVKGSNSPEFFRIMDPKKEVRMYVRIYPIYRNYHIILLTVL